MAKTDFTPIFSPVFLDESSGEFVNFSLIPEIAELLSNNSDKLFDDFFGFDPACGLQKTLDLIRSQSPYFWAIIDPQTNQLAGFVYLYDLVGSKELFFSASISCCFRRKFWGKFALQSGFEFLRFAKNQLRIFKINAEVFAKNAFPQRFLPAIGFKYSHTRERDTLNTRLCPKSPLCDVKVYTLTL
ncbi:GNAT family N-acetyltransferase [bacterium]|nr:GNAT family N-acetyltransferase [bacterium]